MSTPSVRRGDCATITSAETPLTCLISEVVRVRTLLCIHHTDRFEGKSLAERIVLERALMSQQEDHHKENSSIKAVQGRDTSDCVCT